MRQSAGLLEGCDRTNRDKGTRHSTEHPEPVVAIAYQGASEAKNQLENQTVVLSEREVTIQSLGRELTNVRDQVQNAPG